MISPGLKAQSASGCSM